MDMVSRRLGHWLPVMALVITGTGICTIPAQAASKKAASLIDGEGSFDSASLELTLLKHISTQGWIAGSSDAIKAAVAFMERKPNQPWSDSELQSLRSSVSVDYLIHVTTRKAGKKWALRVQLVSNAGVRNQLLMVSQKELVSKVSEALNNFHKSAAKPVVVAVKKAPKVTPPPPPKAPVKKAAPPTAEVKKAVSVNPPSEIRVPGNPSLVAGSSNTQQAWAITTTSVGVVVLGIGGYFYYAASSDQQDLQAQMDTAKNGNLTLAMTKAEFADKQDSIDSDGAVAGWMLGLGSVISIGGAVWWIMDSLKKPKTQSASLSHDAAPSWNVGLLGDRVIIGGRF